VTDTAVSQAMVAQGLGITTITSMMLALAPSHGLRTLRLRDDVHRHVVLVRRARDSERPSVRAMTAAIEHAVGQAVAT